MRQLSTAARSDSDLAAFEALTGLGVSSSSSLLALVDDCAVLTLAAVADALVLERKSYFALPQGAGAARASGTPCLRVAEVAGSGEWVLGLLPASGHIAVARRGVVCTAIDIRAHCHSAAVPPFRSLALSSDELSVTVLDSEQRLLVVSLDAHARAVAANRSPSLAPVEAFGDAVLTLKSGSPAFVDYAAADVPAEGGESDYVQTTMVAPANVLADSGGPRNSTEAWHWWARGALDCVVEEQSGDREKRDAVAGPLWDRGRVHWFDILARHAQAAAKKQASWCETVGRSAHRTPWRRRPASGTSFCGFNRAALQTAESSKAPPGAAADGVCASDAAGGVVRASAANVVELEAGCSLVDAVCTGTAVCLLVRSGEGEPSDVVCFRDLITGKTTVHRCAEHTVLARSRRWAGWFLTPTAVTVFVPSSRHEQLIDNTILFEKRSTMERLCELNGWDADSLKLHALRLGIKFRQLALVREALEGLHEAQMEQGCEMLEEFFEREEGGKVRKDHAFIDGVLQMALSFVTHVVGNLAATLDADDGKEELHRSQLQSFSRVLEKMRGHAVEQKRRGRATSTDNSSAREEQMTDERAAQLFFTSSASTFHQVERRSPDVHVIWKALMNGHVSEALAFLRHRRLTKGTSNAAVKSERIGLGSLTELRAIGFALVYQTLADSGDIQTAATLLTHLGAAVGHSLKDIAWQACDTALQERILARLEAMDADQARDGRPPLLSDEDRNLIRLMRSLRALLPAATYSTEALRLRKHGEQLTPDRTPRPPKGQPQPEGAPSPGDLQSMLEMINGNFRLPPNMKAAMGARPGGPSGPAADDTPSGASDSGSAGDERRRSVASASVAAESDAEGDSAASKYFYGSLAWLASWSEETRSRVWLDVANASAPTWDVAPVHRLRYLAAHNDWEGVGQWVTALVAERGFFDGKDADRAEEDAIADAAYEAVSLSSSIVADIGTRALMRARLLPADAASWDVGTRMRQLSAAGLLLPTSSHDTPGTRLRQVLPPGGVSPLHAHVLALAVREGLPELALSYLDAHKLALNPEAAAGLRSAVAAVLDGGAEKGLLWFDTLVQFRLMDWKAAGEANARLMSGGADGGVEGLLERGHFVAALGTTAFTKDSVAELLGAVDPASASLRPFPSLVNALRRIERERAAAGDALVDDSQGLLFDLTSSGRDTSVVSMLDATLPVDIRSLFAPPAGSEETSEGLQPLPSFSAFPLLPEQEYSEELDFGYYLRSGRPVRAFRVYCARRGASLSPPPELRLMLPEEERNLLMDHVRALALRRTMDRRVVAACVCFLDLCSFHADGLRVDIAVAQRVAAHAAEKAAKEGKPVPTAANGDSEIVSLLLSVRYAWSTEQERATLHTILAMLREATETASIAATKSRDSWSRGRGGAWRLVGRWCRAYRLPIDASSLVGMAEQNDWVGFLHEANLVQYPAALMLPLISARFSDKALADHLRLAVGAAARVAGALRLTAADAEQDEETQKTLRIASERIEGPVTPEGEGLRERRAQMAVLTTMLEAMRTDGPGLTLLANAVDASSPDGPRPVLAVLASAFKEVSPLECLVAWLVASCRTKVDLSSFPWIASGERYHEGHLAALVRLLCDPATAAARGREPVFLLVRGFEIFSPESPFVYFLSFLRSFSFAQFDSARSALSEFVTLIDGKVHGVVSADWMALNARHVIALMYSGGTGTTKVFLSVPERRQLLRMLEAVRFDDRVAKGDDDDPSSALGRKYLYSRMWRTSEMLSRHRLETAPDDPVEEIVAALIKIAAWEDAHQLAHEYGHTQHEITLQEANDRAHRARSNAWLWAHDDERIRLWNGVDLLFVQYDMDPETGGDFFESQVDMSSPPSATENAHLLELALHWFRGEKNTASGRVVRGAAFLENMQNRIWLLRSGSGGTAGEGGASESKVLEGLVTKLLNEGLLEEATNICKQFNYHSTDLALVRAALLLATGDVQPRGLPDEILTMIGDVGSDGVVAILERMQRQIQHAPDGLARILTNYKVAQALTHTYADVVGRDPLQVLYFLLMLGPDVFRLAATFVSLNRLDTKKVAKQLADAFAQSLDNFHHERKKGTAGSDEEGLRPPMWEPGAFAAFAALCPDPSELGRFLITAVGTGRTPACEVELISCASFCADMAGAVEGLGGPEFIRLIRQRVEEYAKGGRFGLIARLYVALKHYSDMEYALEKLYEANKFDHTLRKHPVEEDWQLPSALHSFLRAHHPEDDEMQLLLFDRFNMFRQRAQFRQAKAHAKLAELKNKKPAACIPEITLAMRGLLEAADDFKRCGAYKFARPCLDKAALVALQLQDPATLVIGLSDEDAAAQMASGRPFNEAQVIAAAYGIDRLPDWVKPFYTNVVVNGNAQFMADFRNAYPLDDAMVSEIATYYQQNTRGADAVRFKQFFATSVVNRALKFSLAERLGFEDIRAEMLTGPDPYVPGS